MISKIETRSEQTQFAFVSKVTFMMFTAIFVFAYWLIPVFQQSYKPAEYTPGYTAQATNDPSLGTKAKSIEHLTFLSESKGAAVLLLSDCSDCNRAKLETLQSAQLPEGILKIAIIVDELDEETIADLSKTYSPIMILEGTSKIVPEWNVFFYPRLYCLDSSGKYIYIQPPSESFQRALIASKEVWK
ncbi:MAG TPA: hypothetical protein VNK96_01960 [Fimbriimonadales bacterium]|nr:hypothetical protein [Fimbriimonadales bacterium]